MQLRPAFVLTLSTASIVGSIGCAEPEPISRNPPADFTNPPEVTPASASAEQTASVSASLPPTASAVVSTSASAPSKRDYTISKNPLVDGKPARLATDKTCFVYLPFGPLKPNEQRPPGTEPPRKKIPCPSGMASDPGYLACFEGTIFAAEGDPPDCQCAVGGNPPPLPTSVTCPK